MRCGACAQALTRTGGQDEYRAGCMGCSARALVSTHAHVLAVATDEAAPMAERKRAGDELRDAIRRAMPGWQYGVARAEVVVWWRINGAAARKGE